MSKLNSICVFGGGSAGWITTLALRTYLPEIPVTILISKKHKNIGVGESTQPDLLDLLSTANIDIADFVKSTDATIKHGIHYKNWNTVGTDYWHPFTDLTNTGMYTLAHHYHKMHIRDPENYPLSEYYKKVHPSYDMCVKNNLSSTSLRHGLHIDADKMAAYLRNFLSNSIRIVECEDYDIKSDGVEIQSIVADNIAVNCDLYVDCTGFSKVLATSINNLDDDGYHGNVDSALFGRLEYGHIRTNQKPYTLAEAWENGWSWTIPLQTRMGSGCVYNSKFCTEDEARKWFLDYWEGALKEENIKKISFSSTSLKNPWKSNVVTIGLSSGWVEPLEATGISWFIIASEVLGILLKNRYFDEDLASRYNGEMRSFIEDVQDFIDVHYMLSERRDTEFWKYQTSCKRHPRLMARLETYKKFMPNKNNRRSSVAWAFNDVSWLDILTGYNFKFDDEFVPEELIKQRDTEIFRDRSVNIKKSI